MMNINIAKHILMTLVTLPFLVLGIRAFISLRTEVNDKINAQNAAAKAEEERKRIEAEERAAFERSYDKRYE